jgi:hypothetical protein
VRRHRRQSHDRHIHFSLTGNLTCLSAANITGTLDIAWTGGAASRASVTGLVNSLGSVGGAAG